ncbi:Zinc finger CCCH-type protein [Dioscorea alata]|uniref:Zinc finger CCCH-type protein n=1 Tax=Dioscorea alata TaxID=55571 RepID=A0ACB7UA23_DIOAL|nr:Zinc finger CCCH-type protein [Dioscorea alata]
MATGLRVIEPPEMDGADEERKRKTDCVYFLASPLTCRKGSECEYRHNDSARFNPIDCCYWLAGGCLNPMCAFRHPPLEGFTETASNSANFPRPTPALTNKSDTPCYFYFNAYCIKGPASVEVQAGARQGTSEVTKHFHPKEVPLPLASTNISEEPSSSAESLVPDFEEQPAVKSVDKLVPVMGHAKRGSNDLQDQNSDEFVERCLERGDWWESSSELQINEDETEYLLAQDRELRQLHTHLFWPESESPAGYDTSYPGIEDYDHNVYNSCDLLYSRSMSDYCQRDSEHSRMMKRTSERLYQRKRRSSHMIWEMSDRDGLDLRDHLRKRRMSLHQPSWRSTRHRFRHSSRDCHVKCLPNRRLASEIGKSMISASVCQINSPFLDNPRHRCSRHARTSLSERGSWRRRTNPYTSTVKYARLSTQVASDFTGPKSLAQIREESRAKLQMSQCPATTIASGQFEGPKPLTELLNHKKRPFQ